MSIRKHKESSLWWVDITSPVGKKLDDLLAQSTASGRKRTTTG
ncbi:hypothetical protein [Orrella sp. 11846]